MSSKYSHHQSSLPRLPIPELESSKQALLFALKPLLTDEQFQTSQQQITNFFAESGAAFPLHKKLEQLEAKQQDSWLKPFWDKAYLAGRAPLHTSTNFVLWLDNQPWQGLDRVEFAAALLQAATVFYQDLQTEKIQPENLRGAPLDMSQHASFMASRRLPQKEQDKVYVADLTGKPLSVCIALRGHLFKVQTSDAEGKPYSRAELEAAIHQLLLEVKTDGTNMGIHTTADRDKAASIYTRLTEKPSNNKNLQELADALFLLVLEEKSHLEQEMLPHLLFDGRNKWFDKTLQLVLDKDVRLGANIEHTAVDGTSVLSILGQLIEQAAGDNEPLTSSQPLPAIEKLIWELDEQLLADLNQLEAENDNTLANYWLHTEHFTGLGTDEIKQAGFSPDAFFHMALQVAQVKTFGQMRSTYESVAMRTYYQGRTECLRPSNAENLALAKTIEQGASAEQIYALMQTAAAAHTQRMRLAQQGKGFERHLYGLQQVYQQYGQELGIQSPPELFADEGYRLLTDNFISTSNITSPLLRSCAFAPVTEEGYGIAYMLFQDKIVINLSSHSPNSSQAKLLLANLLSTLKELHKLAMSQR